MRNQSIEAANNNEASVNRLVEAPQPHVIDIDQIEVQPEEQKQVQLVGEGPPR